jgi:ABC-type Fe3+-siderophore transport system permease subunit
MGAFTRWILHEDQKEAFEFFFASALTAVFLAVVALAFWPLGRASLALDLLKGYWVLWIAISWTAVPLFIWQRLCRVDLYSHPDAYVISGLALSGFLQAGWSAFAAIAARDAAAAAPAWLAVVLYLVWLFSCYVAAVSIATYYQGHIYKFVNLLLSVLTYALFCVWPAAARAVYGWFFDLCRAVFRRLLDLF